MARIRYEDTLDKAITKLGAKERAILSKNTAIRRKDNGTIAVTLYSTDIVQLLPDGTIVLDSGGEETQTTKRRMNELLHNRGVHIYQEDYSWCVTTRNDDAVEFADNMKIAPDGAITYAWQ